MLHCWNLQLVLMLADSTLLTFTICSSQTQNVEYSLNVLSMNCWVFIKNVNNNHFVETVNFLINFRCSPKPKTSTRGWNDFLKLTQNATEVSQVNTVHWWQYSASSQNPHLGTGWRVLGPTSLSSFYCSISFEGRWRVQTKSFVSNFFVPVTKAPLVTTLYRPPCLKWWKQIFFRHCTIQALSLSNAINFLVD